MFKKFSSEEVSAQNQVKASVQRRIRQSIAKERGIGKGETSLIDLMTDEMLVVVQYLGLEPVMEDFLPKKSPLIVGKCQNHLKLVPVNNVLLFFNIRDGPYMPTLRLLHQYPEIMKKLQVDRGAIRIVLSGANIMCPGGILNDEVEAETPVICNRLCELSRDQPSYQNLQQELKVQVIDEDSIVVVFEEDYTH